MRILICSCLLKYAYLAVTLLTPQHITCILQDTIFSCLIIA